MNSRKLEFVKECQNQNFLVRIKFDDDQTVIQYHWRELRATKYFVYNDSSNRKHDFSLHSTIFVLVQLFPMIALFQRICSKYCTGVSTLLIDNLLITCLLAMLENRFNCSGQKFVPVFSINTSNLQGLQVWEAM